MPAPARRLAALGAVSLLAGAGLVGLAAAPAYAATLTVISTDGGTDPGTFLWAIDQAETTAGADEIVFDLPGSAPWIITLDFDVADLTEDDLTITGPTGDPADLVLDFDDEDGLWVYDADLVISGITLLDARYPIYADSTSTLTVTDTVIDGGYVDGSSVEGAIWGDDADEVVLDGVEVTGVEGGAGIRLELSDGTASLTGVTASGNEYHGISADLSGASDLALADATADGNGRDGVSVIARQESTATLTEVSAADNGEDGIDIHSDDDAEVTASGLEASGQDASGSGPDTTGVGVELSALDGSIVDVSDVTVSENGIGIHFWGDDSELSASRVTATDNVVAGGFISYDDDVSVLVEDSTFDGSETGMYVMPEGFFDEGEDSYYFGFDVTLSGSTFSNNEYEGVRAFLDEDGALTIVNSTISGNAIGESELGISAMTINGYAGELDDSDSSQDFSLLNSTISDNGGNVGAWIAYTDETLISHSIIAGNGPSAVDLVVEGDTEIEVEWSLIGSTEEAAGSASDLEAAAGSSRGPGASSSLEATVLVEGEGVQLDVTDPGLGPLADNGGPTQTHLPLSTSPAVDGGDPDYAGGLETDQRGESRIQGSAIDIGAVEADPTLPATGTEAEGALGAATLLLLLGAGLLTARSIGRRRTT